MTMTPGHALGDPPPLEGSRWGDPPPNVILHYSPLWDPRIMKPRGGPTPPKLHFQTTRSLREVLLGIPQRHVLVLGRAQGMSLASGDGKETVPALGDSGESGNAI